MFIIPFIHKQSVLDKITISIFQILTVGGKELWTEDNSFNLENDILVPNGIFLEKSPIQNDNTFLCKVDVTKTNISDFYKWDEIKLEDKDIFCWRTFYTFGEKDNYCNWLPVPTNQYIGKYNYKDLIDMIYQSHINDIPVTHK